MLASVNIELLVELLCCKSGGILKGRIIQSAHRFGVSNLEINRLFNRIHYARARSGSFSPILLRGNKWYTFDNREYCQNIIRFLRENPVKPTVKPTGIPFWVFDRYELSRSVFF